MGLYLLIYIDKDFQLSAYFPDKYWLWLTSGNMWELRCLELLRESRGIPQREKMKNNFQFESILKNAKGDNKAFPKLGNVLMLPNQKNL